MKRLKFVAMLCSFVFVVLAIAPRAKADQFDNKTFLTFSEPIEVPGVGAQILPAGTYMFKLLDSQSDRDIVQIFSEDGLHLYTTILAIPDYRLKVTGKTVLTFKERGEGQPEAIKAWFYPGRMWGQEFVYPKERAVELAKVVDEPVLEMPIEIAVAEPVETLRSIPVTAVQPTGEEVPVTAVVEPPPQATAEATAPDTTPVEVAQALPETASSLPLFGLIGLLSLLAGFTLLIVTKRAA
jgi:hypothetical protein